MVGDIFQPTHLLLILVVALFVLGPKRLPEVGRTLGSGIRDFRSALSGESSHDSNRIDGSTADQAGANVQTTPTVTAEPAEPTAVEPATRTDAPLAAITEPADAHAELSDAEMPADAIRHAGPVIAGPPPAAAAEPAQRTTDA